MFGDYHIEVVNLKNTKRFREIEQFLAKFNLSFDGEVEYTVALRQEDRLVGTGSFAGEVLRNIAVDETIQGAGLTSLILTSLMQEQARRGRMHYFIFTKPSAAHLFASLGFQEIARAEPFAVLLESGLGSVATYCAMVEKEAAHLSNPRSAVVVNCNPFTKGHRALISQAAEESSGVIVFVVSEDKSLFPFEHRIQLVKAGLADLPNVVVVPAGKYIISAATFPTYFTREVDQATAQSCLDIELFASQIANRLNITTRYIGEEPYCAITNAYNQAMKDILPRYGIELRIIQRIEVDGDIISASKVRDMIRQGDWEGIKKVVPLTTHEYLQSEAAKDVIEKIITTNSRH